MRAYPTTTHNAYRAKISDGKSVKLRTDHDVQAGNFYEIGGFFGAAFQSTEANTEVVLSTEQAEYETDQIDTTQTFEAGTTIYFDRDAKVFTETEGDNRLAGIVTNAKDNNNVIMFILAPQIRE